MKTLLILDSSGRESRSITRRLTGRFAQKWQALTPNGQLIRRDLTAEPPPFVNEAWIAAAFADPGSRAAATRATLAESDLLISELERADAIVVGAPMYNFGVPAALKAWIDQIVRVGRTFAFHANAEEPYQPLLAPKPVAIVVSTGDASLHPGGAMEQLNFLEPHLRTVFGFIGYSDLEFVRVGNDEFQDETHAVSLASAEQRVDTLAERWAREPAAEVASA